MFESYLYCAHHNEISQCLIVMVLTITILDSAEKGANWILRLRFSSKICCPQPTDCRCMCAHSVQGWLWWWQWYDGHGDDSDDDSDDDRVGDGDHSTRSTKTNEFSSSTFMSNLVKTQRFYLAKSMVSKTQLLPMNTSLSCSSQALCCDADIKQALKQAMKQAYKSDIKQASE